MLCSSACCVLVFVPLNTRPPHTPTPSRTLTPSTHTYNTHRVQEVFATSSGIMCTLGWPKVMSTQFHPSFLSHFFSILNAALRDHVHTWLAQGHRPQNWPGPSSSPSQRGGQPADVLDQPTSTDSLPEHQPKPQVRSAGRG